MSSESDDGRDLSYREHYRWDCPLCGKCGLQIPDGESGKQRVKVDLRSHVLASDGKGHGPRFEFPDGFDPETLVDHVVAVGEKDGQSGVR